MFGKTDGEKQTLPCTYDNLAINLLENKACLVVQSRGLGCQLTLQPILPLPVEVKTHIVELLEDVHHTGVPLQTAIVVKQHLWQGCVGWMSDGRMSKKTKRKLLHM